MTYRLATLRVDSASVPAIEVDGRHFALSDVAPELLSGERGLIGLFRDWHASHRALTQIAANLPASPNRALNPKVEDFEAPLQYPNKLVLGGANYYEHMFKDAGKPDFRKEDNIPVFFLKPPTTTLVGCGKTVQYPAETTKLDWEIELAVIMGAPLRRASVEEAVDAVACFAVGIDLSARDWQMNPRHPWKFDLFTGKAFDRGCPMGPYLVPKEFVDHGNLRLTLKVNGATKQDASTQDMIWSIGEQLSLLSEHITLEPGDVLLTGTPAGVGMATGEYLKEGDRIEAEISGLGTLSVEITPARGSERTPRAG